MEAPAYQSKAIEAVAQLRRASQMPNGYSGAHYSQETVLSMKALALALDAGNVSTQLSGAEVAGLPVDSFAALLKSEQKNDISTTNDLNTPQGEMQAYL